MTPFIFKLPDLGEGTVEAELLAWHVKAGDPVAEDQIIAEVMTEKAAVELPSPISGRVLSTTGHAGDMLRVGAEIIRFETQSPETAPHGPLLAAETVTQTGNAHPVVTAFTATVVPMHPPTNNQRVMASPSTRRRAREAGIDLRSVLGSGPGGRILARDIDSHPTGNGEVVTPIPGSINTGTEEIKVIGLRRVIAQRMSEAKRSIPHFSYMEEIDVTELESLRAHLNTKRERADSLTYLPFIITALVRVLRDFPQCNALYDAGRGVIVRHGAVHVGIAAQTPDGLLVPVLRNAESLSLTQIAAEVHRLADNARNRKSPRAELSGSTITVSSLGKLGGIASTPVINPPEVAIIGVNNAMERPVVQHGVIVVRRMMNLSSSFDHRFVDGFDAAAMIQTLKSLLEHPATLFL